jgi:hypothetical protein
MVFEVNKITHKFVTHIFHKVKVVIDTKKQIPLVLHVQGSWEAKFTVHNCSVASLFHTLTLHKSFK